jgi:hypothetical protein
MKNPHPPDKGNVGFPGSVHSPTLQLRPERKKRTDILGLAALRFPLLCIMVSYKTERLIDRMAIAPR